MCLKQETLQLLRDCQLHPMAKSLDRWSRNPQNLQKSYWECIHALVQDFAQTKEVKRTEQFLLRTGFASVVALANVWVGEARGLPEALWANLKNGAWMDDGISLVIHGEHGTGKTFLAGALARHAAMTRRAVRYMRCGTILDRIQEANADKTKRLCNNLINATLLVIDQVAEDAVSTSAGALLRDVLDERERRHRATILVSTRHPEDWEYTFENPDHASAMAARLLNRSLLIHLRKSSTSLMSAGRAASTSSYPSLSTVERSASNCS